MWIGVGGFGVYIGPLWASLWAYMGEYVEMSGTAGTVITIGSGFAIFHNQFSFHLGSRCF